MERVTLNVKGSGDVYRTVSDVTESLTVLLGTRRMRQTVRKSSAPRGEFLVKTGRAVFSKRIAVIWTMTVGMPLMNATVPQHNYFRNPYSPVAVYFRQSPAHYCKDSLIKK